MSFQRSIGLLLGRMKARRRGARSREGHRCGARRWHIPRQGQWQVVTPRIFTAKVKIPALGIITQQSDAFSSNDPNQSVAT
jgi:hypothetical protein